MSFDWQNFLDQYHVDYITSGPRVARNNLGVKCPWCGGDDPGYHMGISIDGQGWGCWRNQEHRGKSPARLVQALINCTTEEARRITGGVNLPDDFLGAVMAAVNQSSKDAVQLPPLNLPQDYRRLDEQCLRRPSSKPFIRYLVGRGFTHQQIVTMFDRYEMHYASLNGPFKGRVIFPIRQNGKLVTWTGRTIYPDQQLRYKTLSIDPEKSAAQGLPVALGPITDYLLWYDYLKKSDADTLFVCEGPFDALKVAVLGRPHGITATCVFTSGLSPEQTELLHDLFVHFRHRRMVLDRDMFPKSVSYGMSSLNAPALLLPKGVKDPGELTEDQLLVLAGLTNAK